MFKTNIRFRKQQGRHDEIRKRFASGNLNIVYVTSLFFDVIGRICAKKKNVENVENPNLLVSTDSP